MKPETLKLLGLYIYEERSNFIYFYVDPKNTGKISYDCGRFYDNIVVTNRKFPSIDEDVFLERIGHLGAMRYIQTSNEYLELQILKTPPTHVQSASSNKLIEWLTK